MERNVLIGRLTVLLFVIVFAILKNSGLKTRGFFEFFRPRKFVRLLRAKVTERARTNFLSVMVKVLKAAG